MLDKKRLPQLLAGLGVALSLSLGCNRSDEPDPDSIMPPLPGPGEVQPSTEPTGTEELPYEYKIGSADQCELLLAADPAALLGVEIGPEFRTYGLCRYEAKVWLKQDPERAVGLEMRREPNQPVPVNFEEFWVREGGGVDLMGGKRENVVELKGLGDYALWFPTARGLQLYAYWDTHNVLVLTIAGATVEKSLPWAQDLAKKAIEKASAPVS